MVQNTFLVKCFLIQLHILLIILLSSLALAVNLEVYGSNTDVLLSQIQIYQKTNKILLKAFKVAPQLILLGLSFAYCHYCSVFSLVSLSVSGGGLDFGAVDGLGLRLDWPDLLPPRWLLASSACRL